MSKKLLVILSLFLVLPFLAGCVINFKTNSTVGNDGGVYKSLDSGDTWLPKVLIPTIQGAPASIATVNISKIVFDPQDSKAVYLVTASSGLIFSYDSGESWQLPVSVPKEMTALNDAAVDPSDSCTIYAAAANHIFKSTSCSRNWQDVYFGTRATDAVTALAIDKYNPGIIYAGTSEGNIMQSTDRGQTWTTLKNVSNRIRQILIDPYDTRIVFVATNREGIFKTTDKGAGWIQIKDVLGKYPGGLDYKGLIYDTASRNSLTWAAQYGLLSSPDGGLSWAPIKLVTGEGKANIYSLAIDPDNSKIIYYATENTFYKTVNGGLDWSAKKLPSSRAATAMMVNPDNAKVLYLGFTKLGK